MWTIEFYEMINGDKPAEEFLDTLNMKMRAKAVKEIKLLEESGNLLREPYSKHMREGVFELRTQIASDISRIFYFFYIDKRIVLTNGFIKKTQKTPEGEIKKALKYKADFLERMSKND